MIIIFVLISFLATCHASDVSKQYGERTSFQPTNDKEYKSVREEQTYFRNNQSNTNMMKKENASDISKLYDEWINFKQTYGKEYQSIDEEQTRFKNYKKNMEMIKEHNKNFDKGLVLYKLKMNENGDMGEKNLIVKQDPFTNTSSNANVFSFKYKKIDKLPGSMDWRKLGAVTRVKDQGTTCHCCWAFCVTGALEGHYFIKTGRLVSLSEQQLVDCSEEDHGCTSGDVENTFQYVAKNGGVVPEASYPYRAEEGTCRFDRSKLVAWNYGYVNIPEGDEEAIKVAVATVGPVIVTLDARMSFLFYDKGLYDETSCQSRSPNHGVLVVGYGREKGRDYWLVKNSHGTHWGMGGYMKMARNKNVCGITYTPCYPLL